MLHQILLKIIQNARLAGLNDLLQAAAFKRGGVALWNFHDRSIGPRPSRAHNRSALLEQRESDPVVRDDRPERFKDVGQYVIQEKPGVDLLGDLAECVDFFKLFLKRRTQFCKRGSQSRHIVFAILGNLNAKAPFSHCQRGFAVLGDSRVAHLCLLTLRKNSFPWSVERPRGLFRILGSFLPTGL